MKQLIVIQDWDFKDELNFVVDNHELGANLAEVSGEDNAFVSFDSVSNRLEFRGAEAGRNSFAIGGYKVQVGVLVGVGCEQNDHISSYSFVVHFHHEGHGGLHVSDDQITIVVDPFVDGIDCFLEFEAAHLEGLDLGENVSYLVILPFDFFLGGKAKERAKSVTKPGEWRIAGLGRGDGLANHSATESSGYNWNKTNGSSGSGESVDRRIIRTRKRLTDGNRNINGSREVLETAGK
jgi:hypothetical protein